MYNLPTHVRFEGKEYPINTDFRVALQCLELQEDESVSGFERAVGTITLLFGSDIPVAPEVLEKAVYFLQLGETREEQDMKERVLDFKQDRALIYASFLSQYNIRLKDEEVHWWEFMQLLGAIDPKTPLGQVVSIRSMDLSDIKDPELRKHYAELKQSVALEDEHEDEVLDEFIKELYG